MALGIILVRTAEKSVRQHKLGLVQCPFEKVSCSLCWEAGNALFGLVFCNAVLPLRFPLLLNSFKWLSMLNKQIAIWNMGLKFLLSFSNKFKDIFYSFYNILVVQN